MKNPAILVATALLVAACATTPPSNEEAALKKRFHEVDVSRDGKISRAEFTDFMIEEAFKRYDRNHNGYITLKEYLAGGGSARGAE